MKELKDTSAGFVELLGKAQLQLKEYWPIYGKWIKGTPLENDIPVWLATFAIQAIKSNKSPLSRDELNELHGCEL